MYIDNQTSSSKVIERRIHVKDATFKNGLDSAAHRWFRLTPSFGPELVRDILQTLKASSKDVILDPFGGAGTTVIEAKRLGYRAVGFEINPLLAWVGNSSMLWSVTAPALQGTLDCVYSEFATRKLSSPTSVNELGLDIPTIHNIGRWWRDDVLVDLLILRDIIENIECDADHRQLMLLGLASALVPDLSNVTLGRLQLHFIDRSNDDIDVLATFRARMVSIVSDLKTLAGHHDVQCRILNTDSTQVNANTMSERARCVVTSPPYPNRYSYVWNTRPHLYFLRYFAGSKEAATLDTATIGGTWGSATSSLSKGVIEAAYPAVASVVGPLIETIREQDNLMANYAMNYFNLLAKQIVAMDSVLAPDARVGYVVGCSRLKGVYVETDTLLGELFEALNLGYEVTEIQRFRKRNSGKDLHESTVFAWKR